MDFNEITLAQMKRIEIINLLAKAGSNFQVNQDEITLYGDLLLLREKLELDEFKKVESFFAGSR